MNARMLALGLLVVLAATACGSEEAADPDADDGGNDVRTIDVLAVQTSYDADEIEVEPGELVSINFTNGDGFPHSFTIEEIDFDIEAAGGESGSAEFTAPDENASLVFFCRFHSSMKGLLSVGAGGAGSSGDGDLPEDGTGEGIDENDDGIDY